MEAYEAINDNVYRTVYAHQHHDVWEENCQEQIC